MKPAFAAYCALLAFSTLPAFAQNFTQGACSPVVTGNENTITLTCGDTAEEKFDVAFVRARLACNTKNEREDAHIPSHPLTERSAPELFRKLRDLDDAFVFVDIAVLVGGYGCGLYELDDWPKPKWGVVYNVGDHLDGFPGNVAQYTYGYRLELEGVGSDYSSGWASVLPFPEPSEQGYFEAVFGRWMSLTGMARIRVTGAQGTEFVEILPIEPYHGLAVHYARINRFIKETFEK